MTQNDEGKRSLFHHCRSTLVLGGCLWASIALFLLAHSMLAFLLALILFVALCVGAFGTLLLGGARKGFFSLTRIAAPLLCVAFAASAVFAFDYKFQLGVWFFEHRLDHYEAIVNGLKAKSILPGNVELDKAGLEKAGGIPFGIVRIDASPCRNNTFVVMFYTTSNFAMHDGFVFDDCDPSDNGFVSREPNDPRKEVNHVTGKWYTFAMW
jgi:hypothetical protein